jgi:hypothetical protein
VMCEGLSKASGIYLILSIGITKEVNNLFSNYYVTHKKKFYDGTVVARKVTKVFFLSYL